MPPLKGKTPAGGKIHDAPRARTLPPRFWRSLDELAGTEEFWEWAGREFPAGAAEFRDGVGRREFLRVMGAALAMAGLGGCGKPPQQKLVPYVEQPEEIITGRPLRFATAFTLDGFATGLLVRSDEGRPTKVDGNPSHPSSLGVTGPLEQAAVLELYDPDRSRTVLRAGEVQPLGALLDAVLGETERQRETGGDGFRILSGPTASPSLAGQLAALQSRLPKAKLHVWQPLPRHAVRAGLRQALGAEAEPWYQFEAADVVVALDHDFLGAAPDRLRLTKAFVGRRRFDHRGDAHPNALWVAEPGVTITGSMAESRLPVLASEVASLAQALGAQLGVCPAPAQTLPAEMTNWLEAVTKALRAHAGRGLVTVGDRQPAETHALVHRLNAALDNVGRTVRYREPVLQHPDPVESLRELVDDLQGGHADSVLIIGDNPVFSAPADLALAEALRRARFSLYHGLYEDETSQGCLWHVPAQHFLETWSDARAYGGEATIVQPLIAPLYGGISVHQLLGAFLGSPTVSDHEVVQGHWRQQAGWGDDFEHRWRQALSDGVVPELATAEVPSAAPGGAAAPPASTTGQETSEAARPDGYEVTFTPDPTLWDGRFANNAWLQELPKPFSKVTWSNPAIVSAQLARELSLRNGDVVKLTAGKASVEIPVWVQPGQAARSITLHLGNGRKRAGRVGTGVGVDVYPLRDSQHLGWRTGVTLAKTGRSLDLPQTHLHHTLEGRGTFRTLAWAEWQEGKRPEGTDPAPAEDETLYPPAALNTAPNQWGMSINLSTCIGCSACVIACQAENNIPTVGPGEVWRGREMHWIRVDHYFEGDPENPRIYQQPIPCMHCEAAPCELVCPVEATLHSADGLNQQVYNRCVGTRYCSNNCPYKVRRFNFLQYSDMKTPSGQLGWNPQVTVRSRGIMEKCTYCVQRIRNAQFEAHKASRPIEDGEVTPACAEVCPADAIVFGDVADKKSRVSRLKELPQDFAMLGELNTRPRTTYLARVAWPADRSVENHSDDTAHS